MSTEHEQQYQQQENQQSPPGQQYRAGVSGTPYRVPGGPGEGRQKSPMLATLLSLFPGLGQVYTGYYHTGFMFALTVTGIIFILNTSAGNFLAPFLGPFMAFFWIFNMIDANRRAQHYNRVLSGMAVEEIPEDFQTAGGKGSMPAGIALVVIGTLIVLDLNFGVSLSWLKDWWPLGLIGLGGWLILKARRES
jgi:hypothetical protein|nr:hypothetical protein [Candidatus Krumholzibacteria bacterium]